MVTDFDARLARDGRRLLEVARSHGDATPIPTCPGMTIAELVRHLGSVYGLVLAWLREGSHPERWESHPPEGADVHEWTSSIFAELVHELGGHDPAEACASWSPADQTFGFWLRRMAAETLIHRYDVENAVHAATALDPSLAADGVDEVMTLWLPTKTQEDPTRRTAKVQVTCGQTSWIAEVDAYGGGILDPRFATPQAEVTGDPGALDLWLWGRVGDEAVTITGSKDAVQTFRAALTTATR